MINFETKESIQIFEDTLKQMLNIEGFVDGRYETDELAEKDGMCKSFNKWLLNNDTEIKEKIYYIRS